MGRDLQGIEREGRDPSAQVGVNRPASIVPRRDAQEPKTTLKDRVCSPKSVRETHRDERRQWRGLQKPAAFGLQCRKFAPQSGGQRPAQ